MIHTSSNRLHRECTTWSAEWNSRQTPAPSEAHRNLIQQCQPHVHPGTFLHLILILCCVQQTKLTRLGQRVNQPHQSGQTQTARLAETEKLEAGRNGPLIFLKMRLTWLAPEMDPGLGSIVIDGCRAVLFGANGWAKGAISAARCKRSV